jgi:murein DD-endopeptidase MepM/ murein hydrolase activator NlpD
MNIVGEGFSEEIIGQIDVRQKVIGSINRTNEQLTYLNTKTGWAKLVSSVDIEGEAPRGIGLSGAELAKQYVLFNGTSNESPNTGGQETYQKAGVATSNVMHTKYAYGVGGLDFGLRPMPGIKSASVKTETRGSLKTATIQIQANNRQQFDIIDILYLRLGYSVLLEWGWSSYFNNDGSYVNDNPYSLADDFLLGKLKYNDILKTIQERRLASKGNYDAIIGKVVNFTWNFTKDGTYEITLTLRSLGDVIESLKANALLPSTSTKIKLPTPKPTTTPDAANTAAPSSEDVIKDFVNAHQIGREFYLSQQKLSKLPVLPSGLATLSSTDTELTGVEGESVIYFKQVYAGKGGTQYYVRLGYFLGWLKKYVIPYVDNKDVALLKVDNDVKSNIIYLLGRQLSSDPGVCLFKTRFNFPSGGHSQFADLADEFSFFINENRYGYIMNAYFNLTYILNQLDALKDTEGKVSLFDLIKSLCDGWNQSTGSFSKLEPSIDEITNEIKIVDQVVLPDAKSILENLKKPTSTAVFDVYGYYYNNNGTSQAGFVRDINFTTTIPPNLATMITIGSTANGYVVGQDSTALKAMNAGLKDRFKENINTPDSSKEDDAKEKASKKSLNEKYNEALDAFQVFVNEIGSRNGLTRPKYNQEAITAFKNTAVTFYEYDQVKQTQEAQNTDKSIASPNGGFLPFDLSLTMDGLSGMKVYQKYTIPTDFLPSNYPTSLEFLIKGITHTIQNNDWVTNIESIAIPKNPFGSTIGQGTVAEASGRAASRGTAPTAPLPTGAIPNNVQDDNLLNFSKFVYPVTGTVTSKITVRAPIAGGVRGSDQHRAIDIGVVKGTPVYSSTDGVVARIGAPGYGNQAVYIKIDPSFYNDPNQASKNGRWIIYGHLDTATVKVGQKVTVGQQIGTSGDKDSPGAFHLHYQIRAAERGFDTTTQSSNLNAYFPPKGKPITAKQKFITA